MPLHEVIEEYRADGYKIAYSTGVVNEQISIDWTGSLDLAELRLLLQPLGLGLTRLGVRSWAIVRLQEVNEASSTGDEGDWKQPAIDHIVVTASRYELKGDDLRRSHVIGPAALDDNPTFAGDSLRIVHRLPGAASIGISAKPNVRGGSDNELLVLFDGVELIEPFHLRDFQSMFSSFNPQTIQSIEFFSGGFPARYGNKMSGVLDIATQDVFEASGGELALSAYSMSALYYNETQDAEWLVSARRGNLDLVLQSKLGKPRYYDSYARYARDFSNGTLSASAFVFHDDILFTADEGRVTSDIDNRYAWLEWRDDKPGRESRTILSVGKVDSLRRGSTFADEDTEGSLFDEQHLDIVSLKHLRNLRMSDRLQVDLGGTLRRYDMDYDTRITARFDVVSEFLGVPSTPDHEFRQSFTGNSLSLFATVRYQINNSLTTELGLRWDQQDYAKRDSQMSPRLALIYHLDTRWDLRFSVGRFHQPHAIYELNTADLETSFSPPQQSDHYILASEYRFENGTRLVAEAFYKRMRDLRPRYINLFDPYVYIPELHQDRIAIRAQRAESKGLELTYAGGGNIFEWNVNYTWSEVRDFDQGRWIERRWDQSHNVNALLNWYLGKWTVGVGASWHTGWATTRLPGSLPAIGSLDIPQYRNNDRLKDYGSLDFKVSYEQELAGSSLQYFLEVTNVVSRSNKGGVDYEIAEEAGFYEIEEFDLQPVFPLVTNLGVVWRF